MGLIIPFSFRSLHRGSPHLGFRAKKQSLREREARPRTAA
jgi:hypothetical protein